MLDSEWVAQQVGRPVIKAFNNVFANSLLEKGVPSGTTGRIALPVAGDPPDARLGRVLADLLGREPYAVQTMVYFKPPGARGQALHQDNYYLRARPGTCVAAWMPLDRCDADNGCLQIVRGSHVWPDLCVTSEADTQRSFTADVVTVPSGAEIVDVPMEPGDVLFFNGQVVHVSGPNRSSRFRRSLIGHYIESGSTKVGSLYARALRFDGSLVELEGDDSGGLCGTWVDRDGVPVVETGGQWHPG